MKTNFMRVAAAAVAVAGMMTAYANVAAGEPGPTPYTYKQATFKAQDVSVQKLTVATQMTKDQQAPARAFTGPTSMVVSPDNPRIVVAATADLRNNQCYLTVSRDAGRTWKFSKEPPTDPKYPYCTNQSAGIPEAVVAWGRDGTLYYLHGAYGDGEGPSFPGKIGVILARTKNLGETWQYTIVDNTRAKTGDVGSDAAVPGLAIDTSGPRDVVYAGFSQYYDVAPDSPLNAPHPMVAVSTDGGATFGAPTDLNKFQRPKLSAAGKEYQLDFDTGFGSPFLVAHDGVVLAVGGANFPFNDQPAPPPEAGTGLTPGSWYAYPLPQLIARSTDQGKTWAITTLGDPILAGSGTFTGLGWTQKGGAKGTFVATYGATPPTSPTIALSSIVVQRSTDSGVTWSSPVAINDDPPEMYASSFYPQLNVAPNGRVDVAWQDNRETTDFHFNVRYTYSTDGGLTWAKNVKINDRPNNFNYGVSFNSDLRQPGGVASANAYAIFGWADTRNANDLTQTQDNYASAAQFTPLPTTKNTTAPVIAAIFGGLVLAGIVLLVVLLIRRASRGPNTGARREAAAVTA